MASGGAFYRSFIGGSGVGGEKPGRLPDKGGLAEMHGPARATANGHVNEEILELYAMGRLGEPKLGSVEEHLLLCGYCQDRLDEIDGFVKVFRQASRQMSETAREPAKEKRDETARVWVWLKPFWAAAMAAAVVLMVTFVLPQRSADTAFQSVDLRALRGDPAREAVADAGRRLELKLDTAGVEEAASYKVEIVEGLGKVVWSGQASRRNGALAVAAPAVKPGQYWVRLFGRDSEMVREYGLKVR